MLLVLSTAAGMVLWIILWALGASGFDAFLVALMLILLAATVHLILPYLPGKQRD